MDLTLNNLQMLIGYKLKQNNFSRQVAFNKAKEPCMSYHLPILLLGRRDGFVFCFLFRFFFFLSFFLYEMKHSSFSEDLVVELLSPSALSHSMTFIRALPYMISRN